MEEELKQLKDQIEISGVELQTKNMTIANLEEEVETQKEKSKKWMKKLDEEVEKNKENVAKLTKQIKEQQEKNYKLEFEAQSRDSEMQKQAIKDHNDDVRKLEFQLQAKQTQQSELEMSNYDLQQKLENESARFKKQE